MAFEQVEINGERYYRERLTASLQTTSPEKISAISGGDMTQVQLALKGLADATSVAGIARTPDAAYLQGIYVSTGFNRNDDIFLPSELARAFGTIRLKPLDVNHIIEERESLVEAVGDNPALTFRVGTNTIVGVIYDVALVHNKSNLIIPANDAAQKLGGVWDSVQAADNDFLKNPEEHFASNRYDVVMAGMLWKWLFPKTVADLSEEINAGHRALSMEVFFRDYDWYVGGRVFKKEEAPHLESAFRKGGLGGQRVGRVLRGMLFGGGGLVRNPANPGAFDYIEVASLKSQGSAVFVSSASLQKIEEASEAFADQNNQSSRSDVGTETNDDENTQGGSLMDLKELTATLDKAVADHAQTKAEKIVADGKVAQLEAEVASLKQSVEAANTAKAEADARLSEATAKVAELEAQAEGAKAEAEKAVAEVKAEAEQSRSQVETLTQRAEAAEAQVKVFEQADIMAKRVASLDEAGVLVDRDEDAQKTVAMSQEEFDAFVAERIKLREAIAAKSNPFAKKEEDEKDMTPEERQKMKDKMKKKEKAEDQDAEDDKSKASEESAQKTEASTTEEPTKVAIFPVFEGISTANRTLASLLANDPNAQDTFSKYANL